MSVWISAIFGHNWTKLTKHTLNQIARASSGEASPAAYKRILDPRSQRRRISKDGSDAFLLPCNFSVHFGRRVFELGYCDRWSRLLLYKKVRKLFFSACRRTAQVANTNEVLICPEGTILGGCLREDITFDVVKQRALTGWGPPDLDPRTFFTVSELAEMSDDRVHYFLLRFPTPAGKM